MSLFDERIPGLPPLAILPANALFPAYDPSTDTTYRVTAAQVQDGLADPQSAWNAEATYNLGDLVTHLGQVWISDEYDNEGNPPGPDSDFWTLEPDPEPEGSVTASNGLTAEENDVKLGGALQEDTVINLLDKEILFSGQRAVVSINKANDVLNISFPDDTAITKEINVTLDHLRLFLPELNNPGEVVNGYKKALDDNVIIWGSFTEINGVAVNGFGLVDKDGGSIDAFITALGTGPDLAVADVIVDAINLKYYIIGAFTDWDGNPVDGLVRLNADGSYDGTFAPGNSGQPSRCAVLSDGSVVLTGLALTDGIEKLDNAGIIDATFAGNVLGGITGVGEEVYDVLVNATDQIFLAGSITEFDGAPLLPPCLILLNADGTQDLPFDPAEAFDNSVQLIRFANAAKTKLFAAGSFANFNGVAVPGLALLDLTDGSLDADFNFAVQLIDADFLDFAVHNAVADKSIFLSSKTRILTIDILLGTLILDLPNADTISRFEYIDDGVDELVYITNVGAGDQKKYADLQLRTVASVALVSTIAFRYATPLVEADLSDEQFTPKSYVVAKVNDAASQGVFAPSAANVANANVITAHAQRTYKVRDMVHVSGMVELTTLVANTLTRISFTVPLASNFADEESGAHGTAVQIATAGPAVAGAFVADPVGGTVDLVFFNDASLANKRFSYNFTYKIVL